MVSRLNGSWLLHVVLDHGPEVLPRDADDQVVVDDHQLQQGLDVDDVGVVFTLQHALDLDTFYWTWLE